MSAARERRPQRTALVGTALVLSLALAACDGDAGGSAGPTRSPSTAASSSPTARPVDLTFGVYGPDDEVSAFQRTVSEYDATTEGVDVKLRSWADHDGLTQAIASGDDLPDVFLVSRTDLPGLLDQKLVQPVDELLDERGVDFGDGYSREALAAFSRDNRLQCMPYSVSPMVIYYNRALVDFDRMRARGLDAPDADATKWSFDQFAAAARFATRPARHSRGVYVEPTLRGLAPFVLSGGGKVFDDTTDPKSLAFSDGDSRGALERTLELLRDPTVTLSDAQVARQSALERFENGRLGMIAGYRSLVPRLRDVRGLRFDVMPMPVLDNAATVGDISGLCLSRKSEDTAAAADFLVNQISAPAVGQVAEVGYSAPANLEVALSDVFVQPGRAPLHAQAFNNSVRSMQLFPLLDDWEALDQAVDPALDELLTVPVPDLEALTTQIDEESRTVLDPEAAASESASAEASG